MNSSSESQSNTALVSIAVLTGAGISAESGIPTFRGEDGLWKNHRAQELATTTAFQRDPALVWEFYNWRRDLISSCTPNPGHYTLAQMESHFKDFTIITQNVDGFHQRAGSKNVIEIHGSIWDLCCIICGEARNDQDIYRGNTIPKCHICNGMMRPAVVWFGESLDSHRLQDASDACSRSETMLIVGTSLLVQPASSLPIIAKTNGAKLIEVNPDLTPLSQHVNLRLSGPAGEMLPKWWQEIKKDLL